MPIYEYLCPDCGTEFEELVTKADTPVQCPSCNSGHPEKLISCCQVHGAGSGDYGDYAASGGGSGGGCGGCSGGHCGSCAH